jgi:Kef-type K+ transport system membrane component KefB
MSTRRLPHTSFLLLPLLLTASVSHASSTEPVSTLAHTLIALALIIAFARLCGTTLQRLLGQPLVIGEIIAGILLGPALLGKLLPGLHAFFFPASILPFLGLLATLGVVLFMFLVGMALSPQELRERAPAAAAVASGGMLLPMLGGIGLAWMLYPEFAPAGTSASAFGFFLCISLAVTAFPVLARLIEERGLIGTSTGSIAMTAAALGDAVAWGLMFACILLSGHGSHSYVAMGTGFLAIALILALAWRWSRRHADDSNSQHHLALIGAGLLLAAAATEVSGLHAVMGAFLFGLVLPHESRLSRNLRPQVEQVAVSLLLPAFFAMLGTQLQLGELNPGDLPVFGLIMLIAMGGKIGGCYVAARLAGLESSIARSVAILMNTRGLMELVVLKIGFDLQLINSRLFTLMVLMALLTTLITPLLLDLFAFRPARLPTKKPSVAE